MRPTELKEASKRKSPNIFSLLFDFFAALRKDVIKLASEIISCKKSSLSTKNPVHYTARDISFKRDVEKWSTKLSYSKLLSLFWERRTETKSSILMWKSALPSSRKIGKIWLIFCITTWVINLEKILRPTSISNPQKLVLLLHKIGSYH